MDTCSLLEDGFRSWLRNLLPQLIREGKKLMVPYAVVQELEYLAKGVTSNCCDRAEKAADLIRRLAAADLVKFCGDRQISEQADHFLVRLASSDRFQRRMAFITQDKHLTQDLNLLNRISSAHATPIHTYKLEHSALVRTQSKEKISQHAAGNEKEIFRNLGL